MKKTRMRFLTLVMALVMLLALCPPVQMAEAQETVVYRQVTSLSDITPEGEYALVWWRVFANANNSHLRDTAFVGYLLSPDWNDGRHRAPTPEDPADRYKTITYAIHERQNENTPIDQLIHKDAIPDSLLYKLSVSGNTMSIRNLESGLYVNGTSTDTLAWSSTPAYYAVLSGVRNGYQNFAMGLSATGSTQVFLYSGSANSGTGRFMLNTISLASAVTGSGSHNFTIYEKVVESSQAADKTALRASIEAFEDLIPNKDLYTAASWADAELAYAAAQRVEAIAGAVQSQVDAAAKALDDAIAALVEKKIVYRQITSLGDITPEGEYALAWWRLFAGDSGDSINGYLLNTDWGGAHRAPTPAEPAARYRTITYPQAPDGIIPDSLLWKLSVSGNTMSIQNLASGEFLNGTPGMGSTPVYFTVASGSRNGFQNFAMGTSSAMLRYAGTSGRFQFDGNINTLPTQPTGNNGYNFTIYEKVLEEPEPDETVLGDLYTGPAQIFVAMTEDPQHSVTITWTTIDLTLANAMVTVTAEGDDGEGKSFPAVKTVRNVANSILRTPAGAIVTQKAFYVAEVTGLTPDTRYSYVCSATNAAGDTAYAGRPRTFKTAPAHDGEFTFIYVADSQTYLADNYGPRIGSPGKSWTVTTHLIKENYPDAEFIYHAGDHIDGPDPEGEWEVFFNQKATRYRDTNLEYVSHNYENFISDYVVASTQGNHDDAVMHFHANFPASSGHPITYAFTYGSARFIILNTEGRSEIAFAQQEAFLREQVADAKAKGLWVIVGYHRALYSGGNSIASTTAVLLRQQWSAIFAELEVDVALQGHDHQHSRGFVNALGQNAGNTQNVGYRTFTATQPSGAPLYYTHGPASQLKFYPAISYSIAPNDPLTLDYAFLDLNGARPAGHPQNPFGPQLDDVFRGPMYSAVTVTNESINFRSYVFQYNPITDRIITQPFLYDEFTVTRVAPELFSRDELKGLIDEAEARQANPAAWGPSGLATMEAALTTAKALYADANAAAVQINVAGRDLKAALDAMRPAGIAEPEDVQPLIDMLAIAETHNYAIYTPETLGALRAAIESGEYLVADVIENDDTAVSLADISNAVIALEAAIDGLVPDPNIPLPAITAISPDSAVMRASATFSADVTAAPGSVRAYEWGVAPSEGVLISGADAASPGITFPKSGVYTISVTVTDFRGRTVDFSRSVNVTARPYNVRSWQLGTTVSTIRQNGTQTAMQTLTSAAATSGGSTNCWGGVYGTSGNNYPYHWYQYEFVDPVTVYAIETMWTSDNGGTRWPWPFTTTSGLGSRPNIVQANGTAIPNPGAWPAAAKPDSVIPWAAGIPVDSDWTTVPMFNISGAPINSLPTRTGTGSEPVAPAGSSLFMTRLEPTTTSTIRMVLARNTNNTDSSPGVSIWNVYAYEPVREVEDIKLVVAPGELTAADFPALFNTDMMYIDMATTTNTGNNVVTSWDSAELVHIKHDIALRWDADDVAAAIAAPSGTEMVVSGTNRTLGYTLNIHITVRDYVAEPITLLRLNLAAITRVQRNSASALQDIGISVNDGASSEGVVLTVSNPAMAQIGADGRSVVTFGRAGTVTLTATDPVSRLRHSVTLMIT